MKLGWFLSPVNELDQTAIHPALSPLLGQFIWLVRMARNSRGSGFTTWQTRQIHSPKLLASCGVTSGRWFDLAQYSNGLYFFDDFSKLTCDLGLFLFESFSGFKVRSFDVFWDLGRRLIHCRAVKISLRGTASICAAYAGNNFSPQVHYL
jgi:hypothetical protein